MISQYEMLVLAIKGTISQLPEEEQNRVNECAQKIRDLVADNDVYGLLALTLVGAEKQAEM